MKQKKRLEITRFNNITNSDEIKLDKFYNFLPTDKLKNSLGINVAYFPNNHTGNTNYTLSLPEGTTSFEGISLYRQHFTGIDDVYRLLVYTDNKKIYLNQMMNNSNKLHWLYQMEFESVPKTLAYKKQDNDAIIITDGKTMKIWETNYSPYTVENTPIITDMCMNESVLYCCLKEPAFKVWYATDLNPEKVGDVGRYSGYVELTDNLGDAKRVFTFDENVYVIREFGISKIHRIQKSFTVTEVYSSNTRILEKTACVCGNLLLFMTKEGLYYFNGNSVEKYDMNFNDMLENNNSMCAKSLGNKYYLACRLNYGDNKQMFCETSSYVNNSLVVVNVDDNVYEIVRGVDIKQLEPIKTDTFEKMIILFNGENSNIIGEIVENSMQFNEIMPNFWLSKQIFSSYETKRFTKLVVNADANIDFKLIYDDHSITFTTYNSGLNEFTFKIFGKELKIEISSKKANVEVKKAYLEYYDC